MGNDLPVDLSLILDPAAYWPDPADTPEWPMLLSPTHGYSGRQGRAGAEERLKSIAKFLNTDRHVREPTAAECAEVFATYFIEGQGSENERWRRLGLDLRPRSRGKAGDDAHLMVEAVHIRGYLRKLDAAAKKEASEKIERERELDQRTVDKFNTYVEKSTAEMASLAEAVARHKQRIEDERAFHRCNDLRNGIRHSHYDAVRAAQRIGVEEPMLPTFEDQ